VTSDPSSLEIGLWKLCNTTGCFTKGDIFSFDGEKNTDNSTVLILLILGASIDVLYMLTLLMSFCGSRGGKKWLIAIIISLINAGIAGGCAISSVAYAELVFEDEWNIKDHGWSNILAWVGAACILVSFLITMTLIFNSKKDDFTDQQERPRLDTFHRDHHQYVNAHCVEMKDQLNRKSLVNHGYHIE